MNRSVVMSEIGGNPTPEFRGVHQFESVTTAAELEAEILSARLNGTATPILEFDIVLPDGRISNLTIEVLDEAAMISDAGTTYRCHRLPYGHDEIYGVILLIPRGSADNKALVSVSY